jgi:hypothetical protein
MRFSQAMVKEAFERSTLKLTVLVLSILTLTFGILLIFDLSKAPIIIERACESRLLELSSSSQSKEEVEAFIRDAVALRFDSNPAHDPSAYMVQDLVAARAREQSELKHSNIDQRLIIRSVQLSGDHFEVAADRLVAIGKVRSAIPIILIAKIASKGRSLTNPFGLVLTQIDQVQVSEEKK